MWWVNRHAHILPLPPVDHNVSIFIVRHTERTSMEIDAPLTARGYEQAIQVGKGLAHILGNHHQVPIMIVSSPFQRTLQTAETISQTLATEFRCQHRLPVELEWMFSEASLTDTENLNPRLLTEEVIRRVFPLVANAKYASAVSHAQCQMLFRQTSALTKRQWRYKLVYLLRFAATTWFSRALQKCASVAESRHMAMVWITHSSIFDHLVAATFRAKQLGTACTMFDLTKETENGLATYPNDLLLSKPIVDPTTTKRKDDERDLAVTLPAEICPRSRIDYGACCWLSLSSSTCAAEKAILNVDVSRFVLPSSHMNIWTILPSEWPQIV